MKQSNRTRETMRFELCAGYAHAQEHTNILIVHSCRACLHKQRVRACVPVDCATCKEQEIRRRFVRRIGEEGDEVKLRELLRVPDFKTEGLDSGLRWRKIFHVFVEAVHVIVRQVSPRTSSDLSCFQ